jgi:hypothetical protein
MPVNKHSFHIVDPNLSSFRLLYDFELEYVLSKLAESKTKLYSIPKDNWICISLNAKINDIICIKNHIANIYRRVI